LLILAGALLGVNVIMGNRVPLHSLQLHLDAGREHSRLERELEQLRRENSRLTREARELREDPAAIEAIARRELGLIRPGEFVFLLSDESAGRRSRER
jgi:cell division protein FtsB